MTAPQTDLGDGVLAVDDLDQLPEHPWWVLCRDTFMSGWGHARDRENWLCLACDSLDQAQEVADNASGRTDQDEIHVYSRAALIRRVSPMVCAPGAYLVQLKTQAEMPNWYTPGTWPR